MATDPSTYPANSSASDERVKLPFTGKTVAYLILRMLVGLMLLLLGLEKFKSGDAPYSYSRENWHGVYEKSPEGEITTVKSGRWLTVSQPVYEFGGFNNPEVFQFKTFLDKTAKDGSILKGGERISYLLSWVFYYYSQLLPYAMIISGFLILIGLFNRVALFTGGFIWISMAAGQMTLPDTATALMLAHYTLLVALAAALLKHNRFALTRF